MNDEYLKPVEVALILKIPIPTLAWWRGERRRGKDKGPAFVSIGKGVRYARKDVEQWIDSGRVGHGD